MKVMNVCIVFILLISSSFALGAFSTPYLENSTISFNGTSEFEYNMVFQNPSDEVKYMKVSALKGGEWMDPSNFTIEVPAGNYDTQKMVIIRIPNKVIENGVEKPLEYNKKYTVEYGVSSGDLGGNGMVPVTSQVTKKFYVVVYGKSSMLPKNLSPIFKYATIFVIVCILTVSLFLRKTQKQDKNKETDTVEINE